MRNNKSFSAEDTLTLFNNAIYCRKPCAIEEFFPLEYTDKQEPVHQLFDDHWTDCYDNCKILNTANIDNDPDTIQFVVALVCYNVEKYEEYENYDVITLKKDGTRGWWIISSVYKMLLSNENSVPQLFPVFGNDPILSGTQHFLETTQWNEEENADVEYVLAPDYPLEVCIKARSDWDKLPQVAQDFYLNAVRKRFEEDRKINVDIFYVELN